MIIKVNRKATTMLNDDGVSVKGCSIIYAPAGEAAEYSPLATNPYRGCGNSCSYCLDGETLIQMADGSSKNIQDINIGEEILGVVINPGKTNKIKRTTVLAKVISNKNAYKVSLEDGSHVICSVDHRWFTDRGWKYTSSIGMNPNVIDRPILTTNNFIRKLGAPSFATQKETEMFMLGYLSGMIKGDGSIGIYDYSHKRRKSGKTMGIQHRFRLALKDPEGLKRTKDYLNYFGVKTTDFDFSAASTTRAAITAIGTTSPERVQKIKDLIRRVSYETEWLRGWLSGIFDAEGSHGSSDVIRIANNDDTILTTTEKALRHHGFDYIREISEKHVTNIRIRGGRDENLRFWLLVDPAIKRKFNLDGKTVKKSVRVINIENLNETRTMYDIMTGTETFFANGLVSHNCYVPAVIRMKREEFDAVAELRENYLQRLDKEAKKYMQHGVTEQVMLSFTTDPYHPFDTKPTTTALEILRDHGLGFCTLTKGGSRALRDLDLFRKHRDAFATTLTSVQDSFAAKWERKAAPPSERMQTLKEFHKAGIFTWVSIEPTLDIEQALNVIRATYEYVDLYKIGRANYIPSITNVIDWRVYTESVIELCQKLGVKHYIKKKLQEFLPAGYHNPMRIPQYHTEAVQL